MNRSMRKSIRSRALLVLALGAAALLSLTGLAAAKDRNHDRIPDRWEVRHHLTLKVNQARRDQDRDHLRNRAEFMAGDNPRNSDSDGDGTPDGEENAGTVASFDSASRQLTIDLFGGATISGEVTEQTEIKCEDGGAQPSSTQSGESEPGDDGGGDSGRESSDSNESGDDNGGDSGGNCTAADLTAGAIVHQAELGLENGQAVFDEIELAH